MPAPEQPGPRRAYDATGRQAAARRTHDRVVDACRELLARDGYRATTMRAVAERADVSVETVYKAFTTKAQLAKRVYDVTIAGDGDPVPMRDRTELRRVFDEPEGLAKVRAYATFVTGYHRRLGVLEHVLAEADPDIAALRAVIEQERLTGLRGFVEHLGQAGLLEGDLDRAYASEGCLVLTSSSVFTRLVRDLGWTVDSYQSWLERMLVACLHVPAPDPLPAPS